MKMMAVLLVLAAALAGCTDSGRLAPASSYKGLRMPWQKRADPAVATPLPDPDPAAARQPRNPQAGAEQETPPIAAPRESVVSEPAPLPPKKG